MKKLDLFITTIISLLILVAGTSCSKFGEMNRDPNKIAFGEIPPTKLLQNIIYSGQWNVHLRSYSINSELMNYAVNFSNNNNTSAYEIRAAEVVSPWTQLYRWASSAHHMYKMGEMTDDANSMAIALTLKIYLMEVLTAMYGDIPYSEALRWDEIPKKPKYDRQKEIYISMLEELDYANELYIPSKALDYPQRDLLYGGNINNWKKFTNSLRFRILMRVSKSLEIDSPTLMQEMIDNPTEYPMFTGNEDAAILRYSGISPAYNQFGPLGSYDAMHTNTRAGKVLIDLMTQSGDPRLSFYFSPRNGQYLGMLPGQDANYNAVMVYEACNYNTNLSTNTSPTTLMNYAELCFLKSEAAFRNFISGDAETFYNAGVTASIRQWRNEPAYNTNTFLNSSSVKYNNTLLRIIEQKYISQFMSGMEAWNDYRRTGLPVMPTGPISGNFNQNGVPTLPTRLFYPITTSSTNTENYEAAVADMGGRDDMLTPVWFSIGERY
ncbi:MAG: SusD/RagB family nutrient-binding outer membrane lipoprotein [Bacteroidales bacterium]